MIRPAYSLLLTVSLAASAQNSTPVEHEVLADESRKRISQAPDVDESAPGEWRLRLAFVTEDGALFGARVIDDEELEPSLSGSLRTGDIILHPNGPMAIPHVTSSPAVFAKFINNLFLPMPDGTAELYVRSADGNQRKVVVGPPILSSVSIGIDVQELIRRSGEMDPESKQRVHEALTRFMERNKAD